jgi:purine-nucleoside phosphorylase
VATPHISAEPGQIAPLVVMPGDPKRAERIAKQYFTDVELVSDVRGIGAWTGRYEGTPVTAMASGMGIPSLSIYTTELFRFYGVERIVRVGTCGGIAADVKVRDVAIAASAHTNSGVATQLVPGVTLSLAASTDMLIGAVTKAHELMDGSGATVHCGAMYSSDFFYLEAPDVMAKLRELGTLGVEMEAAGLYAVAAQEHKQALAVCTVSDHLFDHSGDMSAEERETGFVTALRVGLASLLA